MGYAVLAAITPDKVYLVLHQGDQGADDDRYPFADDRRQLVTKAFASAGRHDYEGVLSGQYALDDGVLVVFKGIKAKVLL